MVGFGANLEKDRIEEWKYAYVSYESLKDQLSLIISIARDATQNMDENKERIRPLKIIKALQFYSVTLGEIRDDGNDCSEKQTEVMQELKGDTLSDLQKCELIDNHLERWRGLARRIINLLDYISLNLKALRKIVKKHSKNVEPLLPTYNSGSTRIFEISHPDEPETKLVQATFLPDYYIELLSEMQNHEELLCACDITKHALAELHYMKIKLRFCGQYSEEILQEASSSEAQVGSPKMTAFEEGVGILLGKLCSNEGQPSAPLKLNFKAYSEVQFEHRKSNNAPWQKMLRRIHDMEPILLHLEKAAEEARANASLVTVAEEWFAHQAAIFTEPPDEEEAVATCLGLFLNLMDTFLYMANYNLVIPFITPFCDQLNVSQSYGGMIIGAADLSAMVAAVFYSMWTNASFRQPLAFSSLVLLVSNVMYSSAYDYGGLGLLLCARFLTGFGAARSLNRRYIADFVSKRNRTLASAGFVAASSLGMAVGPFLAIPLEYLKPCTLAGFTINNVTMAGWFMAIVWVLFLVVTLLFFYEPPRKQKLQENADLEQQNDRETKSLSLGAAPKKFRFFSDASFYPTMITIVVLFVLKLQQQSAVSSVPFFTGEYGWGESGVGFFLALMGIVVIPLNILMGALSKFMKDRHQCVLSLLLCFVGSLILVVPSPHPTRILRWQYFTAFVSIYVATVIMEGAAMSLMSKVIAPEMARGTFNAGLLATDSGSLGRFIGNIGITLIGGAIHLGQGSPEKSGSRVVLFGDITYGTFALLSFLCMVLIAKGKDKLKT